MSTIDLADIRDSQRAAMRALAMARSHVTDLFEETGTASEDYASAMVELQHAETMLEGIGRSVEAAEQAAAGQNDQQNRGAA